MTDPCDALFEVLAMAFDCSMEWLEAQPLRVWAVATGVACLTATACWVVC